MGAGSEAPSAPPRGQWGDVSVARGAGAGAETTVWSVCPLSGFDGSERSAGEPS